MSTVAVVGGGVIGSGWAARFARSGVDVTIVDTDPEAERKVSAVLANADRAFARLTQSPVGRKGKVTVTTDLAAIADADFIQENLPEREGLKRSMFAKIEEVVRPDVVIGSSTSGLLPSALQAGMAHPERLVIAHPFNPVYLLPLVEIVGGAETSEGAKRRAAEVYESIGMYPLLLDVEAPGHVSDRLLEAVWREALHLVNDGVATVEQIDKAIAYGPGLRWAFMGSFEAYRMAGGEEGMRHFMAQFGPCLKLPWTKLEAPELTDELLDKVTQQSDNHLGHISIRDLERQRDDCLVAILRALADQDTAAGAVLKRYEQMLHAKAAEQPALHDGGARPANQANPLVVASPVAARPPQAARAIATPAQANLTQPASEASQVPQGRLAGMRVLVTGASSGIGLGVAEGFLREGASVFICARSADVLQSLAAGRLKGIAGSAVCDVTKESDVDALFEALKASPGMAGQLHVLVSNVGSPGPTKTIEELTLEEWRACIAGNLDSSFMVMNRAVPMLRKTKAAGGRHGCSIIAISSTAGICGYPNRTAYASGKWGLEGLVKSLAGELGKEGIRCNSVCPGAMNNERMDGVIQRQALAEGTTPEAVRDVYLKMNALHTFIDHEDIANIAIFLASDAGRKITGQSLAVDGMVESLRSMV